MKHLGESPFPDWKLQHHRRGNSIADTYNLADRQWVVQDGTIIYPGVTNGGTFGQLRLTGSIVAPLLVASADIQFRLNASGSIAAGFALGGHGVLATWFTSGGGGVGLGGSFTSIAVNEWFTLKAAVWNGAVQFYINDVAVAGLLSSGFGSEGQQSASEFWLQANTTHSTADCPRFRNINLWTADMGDIP